MWKQFLINTAQKYIKSITCRKLPLFPIAFMTWHLQEVILPIRWSVVTSLYSALLKKKYIFFILKLILCNGFRVLTLALISRPLHIFSKFNSLYLSTSLFITMLKTYYPNIWLLDRRERGIGGTDHLFYFLEAAHRKVLWPQSKKLFSPRDVLTAPEERTFQTEHRKAKNNPHTQSLPNRSAYFYWISHF